jgi:tetratricopeptide (TPR) repeat protein
MDSFSGDDATLTPLATKAVAAMAALETAPDDPNLRRELLELHEEIYQSDWPILATPTNRVYADVQSRVYDLAETGDGASIESLMTASFGPYGQSSEGSEGYSEMLWALLEKDPIPTVLVLSEIGEQKRASLMERIYAQPSHDYDFAGIAGKLASQTAEWLLILDENHEDTEARAAGLIAFELLFSLPGWERFSPDTTTNVGQAIGLARRFAEGGDAAFLKALMRASMGPYGASTAEGGEWTNEILWTLLTRRTQLTLDALAKFTGEDRRFLVEQVYTRPVHDGFDFVSIEKNLSAATIPAGLEQGSKQIIEAVAGEARVVAPPDAREHVKLAEAAAARGETGYKDAVREYKAAIQLAPDWLDLHHRLGVLHYKHNHPREAIDTFTTYLEMDPPVHPRILNQVGLLVENLKEELAAAGSPSDP